VPLIFSRYNKASLPWPAAVFFLLPTTYAFNSNSLITAIMADKLYDSDTPSEVKVSTIHWKTMRWLSAYMLSKNAKGIHLITMNTPNGQAVQILLEELKDVYGTEWTTTVIDIMTNEQKKDW
jgi:hypothetical protein